MPLAAILVSTFRDCLLEEAIEAQHLDVSLDSYLALTMALKPVI